jgi:hypothetical protein
MNISIFFLFLKAIARRENSRKILKTKLQISITKRGRPSCPKQPQKNVCFKEMKIIRSQSRGTKINLRLDTNQILLFQNTLQCKKTTFSMNMYQSQNQIKPHNQKTRKKNQNTEQTYVNQVISSNILSVRLFHGTNIFPSIKVETLHCLTLII